MDNLDLDLLYAVQKRAEKQARTKTVNELEVLIHDMVKPPTKMLNEQWFTEQTKINEKRIEVIGTVRSGINWDDNFPNGTPTYFMWYPEDNCWINEDCYKNDDYFDNYREALIIIYSFYEDILKIELDDNPYMEEELLN